MTIEQGVYEICPANAPGQNLCLNRWGGGGGIKLFDRNSSDPNNQWEIQVLGNDTYRIAHGTHFIQHISKDRLIVGPPPNPAVKAEDRARVREQEEDLRWTMKPHPETSGAYSTKTHDSMQFNVPGAKYTAGTDVILYNAENGKNSAFAFYKVGEAREPQIYERDGRMRMARED